MISKKKKKKGHINVKIYLFMILGKGVAWILFNLVRYLMFLQRGHLFNFIGFEMKNVDGREFNMLEKASSHELHVLLMWRFTWQRKMHNNV